MSEFAINAVSKNLIVSKVLSKKIFKLNSYYWNFAFKILFILVLLLNYYFGKKHECKEDTVESINHSRFKIIFTLWTKTVKVYI